jgi:hypothetical protein
MQTVGSRRGGSDWRKLAIILSYTQTVKKERNRNKAKFPVTFILTKLHLGKHNNNDTFSQFASPIVDWHVTLWNHPERAPSCACDMNHCSAHDVEGNENDPISYARKFSCTCKPTTCGELFGRHKITTPR